MLRFDLTAMVRRSRPGLARAGRTIVLREIVPPAVLIGNLARLYGRVTVAWWALARDRVLPAYRAALDQSAPRPGIVMDDQTGAVGILQQIMEELATETNRLVISLTADLQNFVLSVERWHRHRWGAQLQPHGVSLQTVMAASDVGDTLEAVLRQNVSLVRNVSDQTRRRIEHVIFDGFTRRAPTREIARQLSEAVGIERRRALRIATDQTVKLSSQLDTERMKQAGIEEWEWRHSGKVHYRPEHKARHGNVYTWANAPEDLPGDLPYCGCVKRARITLD